MSAVWLVLASCRSTGVVPVGPALPPPVRSEATLRFVAIGDTGKGNEGQHRVAGAVATVCARMGCDFVVILGDLLYPRGMEDVSDPAASARIAEMYADAGVPLYLVLGNHDYGRGRDKVRAQWLVDWADSQVPRVNLPANAWFADAGPARLVGLDTNAAFQFGERFQREWLAGRLAESDSPWKVVFGHHPLRSNGPHGNAGAYEGLIGVPVASGGAVRRLFEGSLCEAADLYLAGHDHSRQLLEHCGVTLLVSGAGAGATEIVDRGNKTRFASASLGGAHLALSADGTGEAVFFDELGRAEAALPLRARARL